MKLIKIYGEDTYLNMDKVLEVYIVKSFYDVPNSGKYKVVAKMENEEKDENKFVLYRNDDHAKCVTALEALTENYNVYDLKEMIDNGKRNTKQLLG